PARVSPVRMNPRVTARTSYSTARLIASHAARCASESSRSDAVATRSLGGLRARGGLVLGNGLEIRYRGAIEHCAVGVETRPMARAVPRLLRGIPLHDALEVCAHSRPRVQRAALVTVGGDLVPPTANEATFTTR